MWHRNRREDTLTSIPAKDAADVDDKICDGRFQLQDRILGDHAEGLWRAFDVRLNRAVSIRLVPPTNPDADRLRTVACNAARVVDPRVARVLDVLDSDGTVVIVTEWVDGTSLEQVLRDEMSVFQATQIVRDVAAAVAEMHASGFAHGRIRPAAVMLNPDGEIRLRGHGIDATLWGIAPGHDAVLADIAGLGALLTACVTRRWPGEPPTALEPTPTLGSTLARPSQLLADLPPEIDEIVIRSMAAVPRPGVVKSRRPFTTAEQVYSELAHFVDQSGSIPSLPAEPKKRRQQVDNKTFMKRSVLVAVLAAVAITTLMVSARVFIHDPAATAAAITEAPGQDVASQPAAPVIPLLPSSVTGAESEYRIPILRAREATKGTLVFGQSNAPLAIDKDPVSSWTVSSPVKFNSENASGIILDLGTPRPMRAISFGLLGNNTDISLYASNKLRKDLSGFRKIADVVGAPGTMTLRQPKPITSRYFYIALTGAPKQGNTYQGGISSVAVYGG